eukprot:TRINITY_DN697_c0_g1_i1.p1 TRINITY_DN697_c0_g1~~TRINITY_DN697_c0_g1_i1.p1  ORF type:complete len:597 (-),score=64.80 TRINITY_DN697_c0_g1_i1:1779-3392(-)
MLDTSGSHATPLYSISHDGSELFPLLWRQFLRHEHLRDWLMRHPPYNISQVNPTNVSQGVAFCCNFATPDLWSDMASSFDMGEMFIPDHPYRHFMCGSVVAASPFHKHLICVLGSAATRHASVMNSYKTHVRRMVVDMRSSVFINMIEFSWMEDGMLIVTIKVLVPPLPYSRRFTAGCSGAYALFDNVTPGGALPSAPVSFVSFVEAPPCPSCSAQGSLGCYCSDALALRNSFSSAAWPQHITDDTITDDIGNSTSTTLQNVRLRLASIHRFSHVKVTAHVVTPQLQQRYDGLPIRTYKLGPSRFIIKAVDFRPTTPFESDILRQVADKWRLLQAGSLEVFSLLTNGQTKKPHEEDNNNLLSSKPNSLLSLPSTDFELSHSITTNMFDELVKDTLDRSSSASSEEHAPSNTCHLCGRSKETLPDGTDLSICICMLKTEKQTASSCDSYQTYDTADNKQATKLKSSRHPTCHLCGKVFSQQGSLNRHLKNIHEEKKIPCQYCPMSFGQMFDLRVGLFPSKNAFLCLQLPPDARLLRTK